MRVTFENRDEYLHFCESFDGDTWGYSVAFKMDGSCKLLPFEEFLEEYIEDFPVTLEFRTDVLQISGVMITGRIFLCDFDKMEEIAEEGEEMMESNHLTGTIIGVSRVIDLNDWYDETRRYRDLFNRDFSMDVIDYYRRELLKGGFKKVLCEVD